MILDLSELPLGKRYEDRYGGYLDIFKQIATTPADVTIEVHHFPWCWFPLLYHLNCKLFGGRCVFQHCHRVKNAMLGGWELDRTEVEVLCSFRPEMADALWKVDMQWVSPPGRVRTYPPKGEFIVTTNGAYHRREVLDYLKMLAGYKPAKRKCVLVPCAADKPYPSTLHARVLDLLPSDYYLINATGVLGLVPQDLWPFMPHYDSGIPNEWRLFNIVRAYFSVREHDKVVVYCDYYNNVLHYAFESLHMRHKVEFVLPWQFTPDYVNLLEPERLRDLGRVLGA